MKKEKWEEELNKENPLPRYCTGCGGEMITGKKKVSRRDSQTGKIESYEYDVICKKKKGILGFFSIGWHDYFLIIDTPYEEIIKKPNRTFLEYY